jgi:glycosyltransferase involved in cell wall biosynthesis
VRQRPLVVHPPTDDWADDDRRSHRLMREAARAGHPVVYCNATQVRGAPVETLAPGLHLCRDFAAFAGRPAAGGILYFAEPSHAELAPRLGLDMLVFDLGEGEAAADPLAEPAARAAGVVATSSAPLLEALRRVRPDARLVPDGTDPERWSAAGITPPLEVQLIPPPRVGYVGPVDRTVDVEALVSAARDVPQASFVVAGPLADRRVLEMPRPQNLWLLGPRPPELWPAYTRGLDVLVLPLAQVTHVPGRLWDFLATGAEVVVSLPGPGGGAGGARPPRDPSTRGPALYSVPRAEMAGAVREALAHPRPDLAPLRLAAARANAWSLRWADLIRAEPRPSASEGPSPAIESGNAEVGDRIA